MKILIATLGHSPDDDRIYHRQVRSLVGAGHAVTLITRGYTPTDPGLPGFTHRDLGPVSVTDFGADLLELAVKWRPDVLQVRDVALLVIAGRIRQQLGKSLVYDVGDANKEAWDTFSIKPPVVKQIFNWSLMEFEKRQLRNVDVVLAASSWIERRYRKWGAKTVFVPNYPRRAPVDFHAPREPLIIYHGQLAMERGLGTLIRAFGGVIKAIPEARLEIYGRERLPGLIQKLQSPLARWGMEQAITIRPAIPHEDILARLRQAQIGVIPFLDKSLFRVAPPTKLYEYFLCGCAVVASNLPVLREQGKDAVSFVPAGDVKSLGAALIRLLQDTRLQADLSRRGRELVETCYNWDRMEPEFLKIYENLV